MNAKELKGCRFTITSIAVLWMLMDAFTICYGQASRGIARAGNMHRIPVLCYHQVRAWRSRDSRRDRVYIVPADTFAAEMKLLHDSGYKAILPDELVAYLVSGSRLPDHAFMLTFDDGTEGQYINALPVLNKYGFKATFFVMTVTIGRHDYLSAAQIKDLAVNGHIIGCHTWDHKDVRKYEATDWPKEIEQPVAELQKITGKPVTYFAYPFGVWNNSAAEKMKEYRFAAAFQLHGKNSAAYRLYTLQRILVDSHWGSQRLLKEMLTEAGKEE